MLIQCFVFLGAALACLSEKLLFIELTSTAMEDNRLVNGGLSVCEQNSRIVLTSRRSSFEYSLVTGDSGKVYHLVSEECIETCSTAKLVSGVEMGRAKRATKGGQAVTNNEDDDDDGKTDRMTSEILGMMNKGSRNMFPDDDVTCVTCGKGRIISLFLSLLKVQTLFILAMLPDLIYIFVFV
jgi:hypothetical protein